MTTPQIFRLKSYEMLCGAKAIDNGRYEPTLVISSNTWPSRPRTIAVQRGAFLTAAEAIESAHAQGLEWIENFGSQRPEPHQAAHPEPTLQSEREGKHPTD